MSSNTNSNLVDVSSSSATQAKQPDVNNRRTGGPSVNAPNGNKPSASAAATATRVEPNTSAKRQKQSSHSNKRKQCHKCKGDHLVAQCPLVKKESDENLRDLVTRTTVQTMQLVLPATSPVAVGAKSSSSTTSGTASDDDDSFFDAEESFSPPAGDAHIWGGMHQPAIQVPVSQGPVANVQAAVRNWWAPEKVIRKAVAKDEFSLTEVKVTDGRRETWKSWLWRNTASRAYEMSIFAPPFIRDEVLWTHLGGAYDYDVSGDDRHITWKTCPTTDPNYIADPIYQLWEKETCSQGVITREKKVVSVQMLIELNSSRNTSRYPTFEAFKSAWNDTLAFSRTQGHVNISRVREVQDDVIFNSVDLACTLLQSRRFPDEAVFQVGQQ